MGKDLRERLSMVFFAGLLMALLGLAGLLTAVVKFAGDVVINAMLAGVGLILARLAIDMVRANKVAGGSSLLSALKKLEELPFFPLWQS
jgi:AGZA family xanthine/uracil permease-like MFS transporter